MLSDEEKEAIKEVENYLDYEGSISITAIATLYTAYEKEKEKNRSLEQEKEYLNCIIESDNDNYINKDKIKAKVIEIKNRPVKDEFITASQGKLNTIIEMESLLEKE